MCHYRGFSISKPPPIARWSSLSFHPPPASSGRGPSPSTLLREGKVVTKGRMPDGGRHCLTPSFPPSVCGWLCRVGWGQGLFLAIACHSLAWPQCLQLCPWTNQERREVKAGGTAHKGNCQAFRLMGGHREDVAITSVFAAAVPGLGRLGLAGPTDASTREELPPSTTTTAWPGPQSISGSRPSLKPPQLTHTHTHNPPPKNPQCPTRGRNPGYTTVTIPNLDW